MKILVINAGSSSMKYQLIDMTTEQVIAKGNCERIGAGGFISHKLATGTKMEYEVSFPTHAEAFAEVVALLTEGEHKVINDISEISAIGHRGVHGGEKFASSVLITDEVMKAIDELADLAPLHNPPGLTAMKACRKVFGENVPMVVVFDTAFHQTMPAHAYTYPIPYEYYEKYRLRRYGFHGTSHRFVSNRISELMGRDDMKVVTCHLGNGSSITAVDGGKAIDTSMGFTPQEGVVMGTRSGSIDPTVVTYLMKTKGYSAQEVEDILNKKSGLLGISGISNDLRNVVEAAKQGNKRAELAIAVLINSIKKLIGAYTAEMNGLDALVFTAGIGENQGNIREMVCENMSYLGIEIDTDKNTNFTRGVPFDITKEGAKVATWIIPTDEEYMIAIDTQRLASK